MLERFSDLMRQSHGRVVMDASLTTSTVRYHRLLAEAICDAGCSSGQALRRPPKRGSDMAPVS